MRAAAPGACERGSVLKAPDGFKGSEGNFETPGLEVNSTGAVAEAFRAASAVFAGRASARACAEKPPEIRAIENKTGAARRSRQAHGLANDFIIFIFIAPSFVHL
jgi:hypothetical protein